MEQQKGLGSTRQAAGYSVCQFECSEYFAQQFHEFRGWQSLGGGGGYRAPSVGERE